MPEHVAVIGAGVVGLACAAQLRLRGYAVTVIDPQPPGEGCSFGNAGCLSRASCVPLGLPGSWMKVPKWLLDPAGPLSIRLLISSYCPNKATCQVRSDFLALSLASLQLLAAHSLHKEQRASSSAMAG